MTNTAASSKSRIIGYAVLTAIIVLSQGASGVMDFMHADPVVEGMRGLGYPLYVLYILGFYKVAGVIALGLPKLGRVKEWAYFGFFADFTGAFASHAFNGDGAGLMAPPLVLLGILIGSYMLRPASRRI